MRLTAPDLLALGVVDEVIPEPLGGAHTDHREAIRRVGDVLDDALIELEAMSGDELVEQRYRRFRALGVFEES